MITSDEVKRAALAVLVAGVGFGLAMVVLRPAGSGHTWQLLLGLTLIGVLAWRQSIPLPTGAPARTAGEQWMRRLAILVVVIIGFSLLMPNTQAIFGSVDDVGVATVDFVKNAPTRLATIGGGSDPTCMKPAVCMSAYVTNASWVPVRVPPATTMTVDVAQPVEWRQPNGTVYTKYPDGRFEDASGNPAGLLVGEKFELRAKTPGATKVTLVTSPNS